MKQNFRNLLLVSVTLLFIAVPKPSLQAKSVILPPGTLDNGEVLALFNNKTVISETVRRGRISKTFYSPAGKVEQLRNQERRHGFWRVTKNGRICLRFDAGRERCRIIVRDGDEFKKYIVKKNGKHQHSVTYRQFLSGNQL